MKIFTTKSSHNKNKARLEAATNAIAPADSGALFSLRFPSRLQLEQFEQTPETVTNLPRRAADRMKAIQPPRYLNRRRNLSIAVRLGAVILSFAMIGMMMQDCGKGHSQRTDRVYSEVQAGNRRTQ